MRRVKPPAFETSRVTRRDLALTVPPELRDLPPDLIAEEMARRRATLERFDPWNPRTRRRLKHCVLGAVICLPLFSWFFTPVGLSKLWLQIPIAALFGVGLATTRMTGVPCLGLSMLYGAVHWFVIGGLGMPLASPGMFLLLVSTCLFWVVLGSALGTSEDLRSLDGG